MKVLVYLAYRQSINTIKYITRSPKRLIPAILFAGIILNAVITHLFLLPNERLSKTPEEVISIPPDIMWTAAFLILSLLVVWAIRSAFAEGLLVFSASYVDFLFPSCVPRRSILLMKLLGDYAKVFFIIGVATYLMIPMMIRPLVFIPNNMLWYIWIPVSLLLITATNVSHTLNLIASTGIQRFAVANQVVKTVILLVLATILTFAGYYYLRTGDLGASLISAMQSAPVKIILIPITWTTDLMMAAVNNEFAPWMKLRLFWLLLLSVGTTVILFLRRENFYEPSLLKSERMARVKAAKAAGDIGAIRIEMMRGKTKQSASRSPLPPFGRGATAILWKMLVIKLRVGGWRIILPFVLIAAASVAAEKFIKIPEILWYAPFVIPYFVWVYLNSTPQLMRGELMQIEIIKCIPDKGLRIVLMIVLNQWINIAFLVIGTAVCMAILMPSINYRLLWILSLACITCSLPSIAVGSIFGILYPGTKDKSDRLMATYLTLPAIWIPIIPTLIITGLATVIGISIFWTAFWLVITNIALTWTALVIAGIVFRNTDPQEG